MKKIYIITGILVGLNLVGTAIAQAKDITESRNLNSFEKITIDDAGMGLDISIGKEFTVTLKGSEKWVAVTSTKVKDNVLVISRDGKKKKFTSFDSDNRIKITMPKFTELKVNGAVDADISNVDSENLNFEVNGAANIEITGKCGSLNVGLNGAGNFEGEDLKCENITIQINGAGNVEAYGSNTADLEINGMGNIDLYGKPDEVNQNKSWFSNITIHKE